MLRNFEKFNHTHTNIHKHIYDTHTCHICTHAHMYMNRHTHTYISTHISISTYAHAYTHIYIYIHMHTYIYIHTQIDNKMSLEQSQGIQALLAAEKSAAETIKAARVSK